MNKIKTVIVFTLALFLLIGSVSATTLHAEKNNWSIDEVYKIEDGTVTNTHVRKLRIDSNTPAYCVDYGAHIKEGDATVNAIDFVTYFKKGLSESAAKALKNKLNEYMYFGYGSSGRTSEKYFFATQKLIWEAINDTGFYRTSEYTNRVGATSFTTVGFSGVNTGTIDVSAEVNAIKKSVSDYYIKPSMCSSQTKLEIAVGETKTFTDSNGVLSKYVVTCGSGLTCNTSGNTLTVTANDAGNDKLIRFTKSGAGTEPVLYENPTRDEPDKENQRVITGGGIGPVSCDFGVDTYQNVETGNIITTIIGTLAIISIVVASTIYYNKVEPKENESA